jgi:hypothetical protein
MIARPHSIVQRLEFQYTPVHGNWLNMAEIEIGNFERGCRSQPLEEFVDLCQCWAPWNGRSVVFLEDNAAGTGQKQKSSPCFTHKAGIQGQVGQESNRRPAVLEVAALCSAALDLIPLFGGFIRRCS